MNEQFIDRMVEDLLRGGVSVLSMDSVPESLDPVLWQAILDMPPRADGGLRKHIQLRRPFGELTEESGAALGASAAQAARTLDVTLAALIDRVANRLVELGHLPEGATADPSWASNMTQWLPSDTERLPMHVDWEMLSFVVSPDGGLETYEGAHPDRPVAVMVAGDLCNRFSRDKIPGGGHRVTEGGARRSFQVFYLGNPSMCFGHGRVDCDCGPTVREVLEPQYVAETSDYA